MNNSQKTQPEIQENQTDATAIYSGEANIPPPKNKTSEIEESFLRDEVTKEFYMPLSSTKVHKPWKKNCMSLYFPRAA